MDDPGGLAQLKDELDTLRKMSSPDLADAVAAARVLVVYISPSGPALRAYAMMTELVKIDGPARDWPRGFSAPSREPGGPVALVLVAGTRFLYLRREVFPPPRATAEKFTKRPQFFSVLRISSQEPRDQIKLYKFFNLLS